MSAVVTKPARSRAEYRRAYYLANRDRELARQKAYNETKANKERKRKLQQEWNAANRDKLRSYYKKYDDAHKTEKQQYRAAVRASDPDRARTYRRAYYLANKERELELARIRQADKKEKIREYQRAYYLKNKRTYQDRSRAWTSENPDKHKVRLQRRRARLAEVVNTFTAADWRLLVSRSKRCHWCKIPFSKNRRPTHDHVIPISKGGANTLENSVCACRACNSGKQARLVNPITGQGLLL